MTTIPTPAAEPGSPASLQKDRELINHARKTARNSEFLTIGLCILFGTATAISAQPVLLDFTASLFLAWLLAFAITTSANVASYFAGSKWHRAKATSVVMGFAWALVGAVLVYLCLHHTEIAPPAVSFGAAEVVGTGNTVLAAVRDQAQATILGVLYLLGGIMIAIKGYINNHPETPAHITTVEAE